MIKRRHAICGYAMDLFGGNATCVGAVGDEEISESAIYLGLLLADVSSVKFLSFRSSAAARE